MKASILSALILMSSIFASGQVPYSTVYSDEYMEIYQYRHPVVLELENKEELINFFRNNEREMIPFKLARITGETEYTEEGIYDNMPLIADRMVLTDNYTLLFIRLFYMAGNKLIVLSMHNDSIVSRIGGIILDSDSDGCYNMSAKYDVNEPGQIEIRVNDEDCRMEETGINNFYIEYSTRHITDYLLTIDNIGRIHMKDKNKSSSVYFSEEMEILESWSKQDLRKLRNYIFAKHGYTFRSKDLSEFFSHFEWYDPRYDNVNDMLSEADRKFVLLVKRIEDSK